MRLGVTQVQCVNHHADVGGVFTRLPPVRNFYELERGFMHVDFEVLVALPVAIGFLDHDIALDQQSLQHFLDVESGIACVTHAKGDVLEVAK